MKDFKASNGVAVSSQDTEGLRIYYPVTADRSRRVILLTGVEADALREFFRHERDEELGRWRYPENPDYVVYPMNSYSDPGAVQVLNESNGKSFYGGGEHHYPFVGDVQQAINAYHEAHPLPEPAEVEWEYGIQQTRDGQILTRDEDGDPYTAYSANEDLSGDIPYDGVLIHRAVGPWLPVEEGTK